MSKQEDVEEKLDAESEAAEEIEREATVAEDPVAEDDPEEEATVAEDTVAGGGGGRGTG